MYHLIHSAEVNEVSTERKIKAGRWISALLITGNLGFCIPFFIVMEIKLVKQ